MTAGTTTAADRWRDQLAEWAIPDEIRAAAPAFPYTMDPELFRPRTTPVGTSLATERAADALAAVADESAENDGMALDVGCGGGAASLAVADRLRAVVGVDQSEDMLALFSEEAKNRGLEVRTVCGTWPEVATAAGRADVVLCHHVAYNVADLVPFVEALDRAGLRRVVMELTLTHPQTVNAPLWRQFWNLERPTGPTAHDALAVVREAGIDAHLEIGPAGNLRRETSVESRAVTAARKLCLGPDRLREVEAAVAALPPRSTDRAVIWWDVRR